LRERLAERGIAIEVTEQARQQLARDGYDPVYGARPLKRLIQREIENPLARLILAGDFTHGDRLAVDTAGETSGPQGGFVTIIRGPRPVAKVASAIPQWSSRSRQWGRNCPKGVALRFSSPVPELRGDYRATHCHMADSPRIIIFAFSTP
jgi:hypothetical protein